MRRERTAGVSPRDGIMEVAFEQWTEHIGYRQSAENIL